jgi:hypothetical protein
MQIERENRLCKFCDNVITEKEMEKGNMTMLESG